MLAAVPSITVALIELSFEIEKLQFKLSCNAKIDPQHIEHADSFQSSFSEKCVTNYSPGLSSILPSRSDPSP